MWPSPKTAFLLLSAYRLLGGSSASPIDQEDANHNEGRQTSCPGIHVFGARETTVSQGYGSSITVVNDILNAYSGSTAEAIVYPACGGQSSCGGISVRQRQSSSWLFPFFINEKHIIITR